MARAMQASIPVTQDERYGAIFFDTWEVGYPEILAFVDEKDTPPGQDHYKFAQLVANLATAPQLVEGEDYKKYAPAQGKLVSIDTDSYGFEFRATYDFRKFGRGQNIDQYAAMQADILLNTIKVKAYNRLNNAFDSNYPTEYDSTELCSTSHTLAIGGAGSNKLADADISEATIEGLVQLGLEMVNEDGVLRPMSFDTMITAAAQWGDTVRYTKSMSTVEQGTGKSGNAVNAVQQRYNLTPHNSALILDQDAVFLAGSVPGRGHAIKVVYAERPVLRPSYVDPSNEDFVWPCRMKMRVVAEDWRGIVGVAGV